MDQPRTFVLTINRPIPCFDETVAHMDSLGIKWEPFIGIDNTKCRFRAIDTFDLNRVGERLGPKGITATLSHYLLWKVMLYLPEDVFWVLEYDCEFIPDWREKFDSAMSVLPDDWDIVFIGSCCTGGRPTTHIGKNLYEVRWPLCGHSIMYRKKALPVLLEEHQKISAPLDIALVSQSLPKLRVYTILPRLCGQRRTPLPI